MAKKNRAQLIAALAAASVAASDYEHLETNAELEALLKQKQAEQAMQDAEAGDGEGDDPDSDAPDPGTGDTDATDTGSDGSDATEAGTGDATDTGTDDADAPDTGTEETDTGSEDASEAMDAEDIPGLTKMRAASTFETVVLDVAVVEGRRLKKGDKLKVKAKNPFYVGEKTRDHLLDYRTAECA